MAVHFVAFRDDRYWNAVRVWGYPDFVHPRWDVRAKFGGDNDVDDVWVFADGAETDTPSPYAWDDSARF